MQICQGNAQTVKMRQSPFKTPVGGANKRSATGAMFLYGRFGSISNGIHEDGIELRKLIIHDPVTAVR